MSDAGDLSPASDGSSPRAAPRQRERMQTDEEDRSDGPAASGDDAMDDLFGDDDEEDVQREQTKKRRLDDEELDSGDDLDRDDRMVEDEERRSPVLEVPQEITTTEVEMTRHHTLRGSDGEVYLLSQQQFTGIEPKAFDPQIFIAPQNLHNTPEAPGPQFSAAQTAATTMRWRRAPGDSTKLQSNARIIRWSDGTLTLQIASNPLEQFELPAVARAAPQPRPKKPTPISKPLKKGVQPRPIRNKDNLHTYLCSVNEETGYARVTNHVTVGLAVRSTRTTRDENVDDATLKLQEIMARNAANKQKLHQSRKIVTTEDPLEAQRRALKAEKELAKAERQRQQKLDRDQARRAGVLGTVAGYGRSGGGGGGGSLNLASLEDDPGRPRAKAPRKKATRTRYSDDEDDRRGRTREDEYDEEDDFIAPSDEDEGDHGGDDDDDEEELGDEDADAEGDADDSADEGANDRPSAPAASARSGGDGDGDAAVARNKRRAVIDDDEDDE